MSRWQGRKLIPHLATELRFIVHNGVIKLAYLEAQTLRTISRCKHVSETFPKNVAKPSPNGENVVAKKRVLVTLQNRNKKRLKNVF